MLITSNRAAAQASPSNRHYARESIRHSALDRALFDDLSIDDSEQWITDVINEWVDDHTRDLTMTATG